MKRISLLGVLMVSFFVNARADNPCLENPFVVDTVAERDILLAQYNCPNVEVVVNIKVSHDATLLKVVAGSIQVNAPIENTGDIQLVAEVGNVEINADVTSLSGDVFLTSLGMDLKTRDAQISAVGSIVGSSMGNTRLVGGVFTAGESALFDAWGHILVAPGLHLTQIVAQKDVVVYAEGDVEVRAWVQAKTFKEDSKEWLTHLTRSKIFAERVTVNGGMKVIIDDSTLSTDKHIGVGVKMCVDSMQPCVLIVESELRTLNPGSTVTIKTSSPAKDSSTVAICSGSTVVDGRANASPTIGGKQEPYRANVAITGAQCAKYGLAGATLVE